MALVDAFKVLELIHLYHGFSIVDANLPRVSQWVHRKHSQSNKLSVVVGTAARREDKIENTAAQVALCGSQLSVKTVRTLSPM